MNVLCVVQARLGSSRLPAKSLRVLQGKPIIDHVLDRLGEVADIDHTILATTRSEKDDLLVQHVWRRRDVEVIRGEEHDVLARFVAAAAICPFSPLAIVRITGDCPFTAPEVVHEVLQAFFDDPLQTGYVSNDTTCSGYPDGTDVEVLSYGALMQAHMHATDPADREHVTPWIRREVCNAYIKCDTDWSKYKLSIDRIEDFQFAKQVMAKIPAGDYSLTATMRAVEEVLLG